jgi:hypothetical protein
MPSKYSQAQQVAAFWSKVKIGEPDECWPWKGRKRKSYGYIRWEGRQTGAHRVALFLSGTYLPEGMNVLHACDNPPCCNPKHLFVGNQKQNVADRVAKMRSAKGEQLCSKLKETDVLDLRADRKAGATYKELASRYGIHWQTAYKIVAGTKWKHLPL